VNHSRQIIHQMISELEDVLEILKR
jgi:hypothetical protein